MIKMVIFDLDGVLVDARDVHYEAFNEALGQIGEEFVISKEDHLSKYDGLPTRRKLDLLERERNFPPERRDEVWTLKQKATIGIIKNSFTPDERIVEILKRLKEEGYTVCVASNSIRESVRMMLLRKGFMEYVDFLYSNQDVVNPKPNTEMYLRCMITGQVNPDECVIVEDSPVGRKAAHSSGGHLCAVRNAKDLSYEKIRRVIDKADKKAKITPKWNGGDMRVLIPMAGAGRRFQEAGYTFPKPLIDIKGKPMIQVVVDNLNIDAKHIFIVQKEHYEKYNLKETLSVISHGCEIIQVDGITEGAACTTLLAEEHINNDQPLLIANSDQFIEWDSNEFMYSMIGDTIDGGILTFDCAHPKWSYATVGEDGFVSEVAEKKPISNQATVGLYYWQRGQDYVKYAHQMIDKDVRVNNEFYVCPVYNEAIQDGQKIKIYHIDNMWGLGTPEDLNAFLRAEMDV